MYNIIVKLFIDFVVVKPVCTLKADKWTNQKIEISFFNLKKFRLLFERSILGYKEVSKSKY